MQSDQFDLHAFTILDLLSSHYSINYNIENQSISMRVLTSLTRLD